MAISMTLNIASLVAALDGMGARGEAAAMAGAQAGALVAESAIKKQLSIYSHRKGTPTPSPRGSPPAVVSGTLRRSIQIETAVGYVDIGPTAVYGRIQELGGYAGRHYSAKLPARPYLRPGYRAARGDIAAAAIGAIRRTLGL